MTGHPGFNVIGHVTGKLGLGVLARNVAQMLLKLGYPVAALDVDPGLGRSGHDLSLEKLLVRGADDLPYGINLCVLPAPSLHAVLPSLEALVLDESRINVALPMWELSVLPLGWRRIFEFFDVLVAGSTFIRSTLDLNVSKTFVLDGAQPLSLPTDVKADRKRFGIAEDSIVFLTAYEPHSDPLRKNPEGAVAAYLKALSRNPRTLLLVKVNNAVSEGVEHPSVQRLRAIAAGSEQIRFLTGDYAYADVLCLLASIDVLVSLHRAEGLGLVPMEAMALGKPTIATAWSGNMSYMNHTNTCLVDFDLVPVPESAETYQNLLAGVPATWAEPDLATAAAWMDKLANDAAFRRGLGQKARQAIEDYNAEAMRCAYPEELEAIFRHRHVLCPKISERGRRLNELRGPLDALVERDGPTTYLADAVARNRTLAGELCSAETRLSDVLASTSWRLTAPLRSIVTSVRRFRRNGGSD